MTKPTGTSGTLPPPTIGEQQGHSMNRQPAPRPAGAAAGRPARWGVTVGIGCLFVILAAALSRAQDPPDALPSNAAAGGASGTGAPNGGPPSAPSAMVRIVFKIIPNGNATVMWGKKRLGIIKPRASLTVQRPRDSGPLDVIVRSPGYIPVHSRAYTFTDTTLAVRLTPLDKKNTLYGYREELPPEPDAGAPSGDPDGGVP